MTMTKRRTKKYLAARIICSLVLGAYLVGGHSSPVAWGAPTVDGTGTVYLYGFGIDATQRDSTGTAWGYKSTASGPVATAWGNGTTASGEGSTAWGYQTFAGNDGTDVGNYATAWGTQTNATGDFEATAWGYKTTASGQYAATAFGSETTASGMYATAWGNKTIASNQAATAFGARTEASGNTSTAFGWGAIASNLLSTAFGNDTTARGYVSTAFGNKTEASGNGSTAWGGYFSDTVGEDAIGGTASGKASTAFGIETQAGKLLFDTKEAKIISYEESGVTKYKIVDASDSTTPLKEEAFATYAAAYNQVTAVGTGATAWGRRTTASGDYSTAWGDAAKAEGDKSTAWGAGTKARFLGDTAWGEETTASGIYATAFGSGTTASGLHATAFGSGTTANTRGSTAWGNQTTAGKATIDGTEYSGLYATAFGFQTKAIGQDATAFGSNTTASGTYATAFGSGTTASGYNATAFGLDTTASGDASTAFGIYTEATGKGAVAWGVGEKGVGITLAHGESSTAFGKKSRAFGDNSLAALGGITGVGSIASLDGVTWVNFVPGTGEGAVAIGEGATAEASYTYAIGKNAKVLDAKTENAIAIGNDTSVTAVGGVALGSEAVASVDKGVAGYDPATGATTSDSSGAWTSTHAAISIGTADGSVTRQITGVAAGSKDTDAVNVAQLKAAADAKLDKTVFNDYKVATAATLGLMQNAITQNADDISDLQTNKLDKAVYEADKADTKAALDGKANVALDNITEDGKTVIKDLAKGAVNVVGDGPVSVAKSDVSGVDTYTVSVKTDGKVEDSNTGIVTGGTVYDYLHGDTVELGKGSKATGTQSIAIGFGNKVSGNNSGAIGDPNTVEGDNSWAFGNNNQIPGSNSIVLGNKNNVSGSNTFVLGNNVTADVDNAVVLGDGSKAEADAVSVGSDGGERQIKHVKDGTDDTDAATVGQLKALAGGTGAGLEEVTHRISNLDSKINKVGAGAAALAALHPLDTDNKFTMAAGFGNYRNANAMALGMFYRPTDKVMFSVGGAMGNGENMINAGVSFALDKGVGTSKAAMARTIKAQGDRIAEQDAKIQSLEAYNAKLEERLAALEAKIGK